MRWIYFTLGWVMTVVLRAVDVEGVVEDPLARLWTLGVAVENDLFYDTDRDYTSGVRLSLVSPDLGGEFGDSRVLPSWIRPLLGRLPISRPEPWVQRNVVYSLGQNIYTPYHTEDAEFHPGDRPYAAWLYFGIALHNKTDRWHESLELNLGMVGPWALGEETQNFIHGLRDFPSVNGWEHQIRNEPVVNLIYERKWRRPLFGDDGGWGADTLVHAGGSFGNLFTYANTGGGLRLGWNLPHDFGTGIIRLGGDGNGPANRLDPRVEPERVMGIHAFVLTDGRLVLRDLTLDGNSFVSSHSVERDWWVADFSAGIAAIWGAWKVSYAATYRTRTFEGGEPQTFGSVNLGVTF